MGDSGRASLQGTADRGHALGHAGDVNETFGRGMREWRFGKGEKSRAVVNYAGTCSDLYIGERVSGRRCNEWACFFPGGALDPCPELWEREITLSDTLAPLSPFHMMLGPCYGSCLF